MKEINKELIENTLNKNKDILKKYNIKRIGLFGSYVREEQIANSDIDFLVEFSQALSLFEHVRLQLILEEIFKRKVDIVSLKALKPILKPAIIREVKWFEKL